MSPPKLGEQSQATRRTTSLLHRFRTADTSATEARETFKLGLHEVTDAISCPVATVVFVHGLGGHPVKTWRHPSGQDTFWPQCWLPKEPGLETVRVCIFGYAAEFATTKENIFTIADFAKRAIFDLMTSGMADSPIIFVAHSMGGLVAKKAYMLALQDNKYAQTFVIARNT
ncbi:hypothetical protein ACCO45_006296 [Purpureocillium lilacinum]|uniref:Uncharacterized protein n=2 Tax=Purpureocillium lilacinum TaxID=33203 RepID=A0ACC4D6Z0_PURLI